MTAPSHVANAARARVRDSLKQIRESVAAIDAGRPGDAEPESSRRAAVLQRRLGLGFQDAVRFVPATGAEKTWGKTIDFVDFVFLERGMRAGRAVARVATADGQGVGTGFMISPRLFLTNNHVIPDPTTAGQFVAEFEYERDLRGGARVSTRFGFAAGAFFLTSHEDDLDYTVIALGQRLSGSGALPAYGYVPISGARDKHALGDHVNIIQHPDGRLKEAVLRENQLVARAKTALHYIADTEPGSSGSPVFNVLWDVVALHHWGGPHRDLTDDKGKPLAKTVNEGIRISAIVGDLATRKNTLAPPVRALVDEALTIGLSPEASPVSQPYDRVDADATSARVDSDGTATWTIPLRVSVSLGSLPSPSARPGSTPPAPLQGPAMSPSASEKALVLDENYGNRKGYDPKFLGSVVVPLPKLKPAVSGDAATNKEAVAGRSKVELPYEHFSIVMNGRRRLAFFTATNIDGKTAKNFDRDTGLISDPHDEDDESAEATERWFPERRIKETEQTPPLLYEGQTAFDASGAAIDNRRSSAHRNRIFQQGHLTRRQDPLWGPDPTVIRANSDTFHVTNRAPQVGFFNMGVRKPKAEAKKHPGGQLYWRALEDFVLINAVADKARVTVFTGPIFDDLNDIPWDRAIPEMEGFKVPREFWKVVLRLENGTLRATALSADQSPLIDFVPEALARVMTDAELKKVSFDKVDQYHVSVAEIEARTGIDLGAKVRAADTHDGGERRKVATLAELLGPRPVKSGARKASANSRSTGKGHGRKRVEKRRYVREGV